MFYVFMKCWLPYFHQLWLEQVYLSICWVYIMPSFGELSIIHEALNTALRDPFQEKVRVSWKKHLDLSGRNIFKGS